MANINVDDLTNTETELEELDLITDSEGYLKELSEQEKPQIKGGGPGYTFWGKPVEA